MRCTPAQKQFGDCDIIMGCASYHRRMVGDTPPMTASKVAEIRAFLARHGVHAGDKARKKDVLQLLV